MTAVRIVTAVIAWDRYSFARWRCRLCGPVFRVLQTDFARSSSFVTFSLFPSSSFSPLEPTTSDAPPEQRRKKAYAGYTCNFQLGANLGEKVGVRPLFLPSSSFGSLSKSGGSSLMDIYALWLISKTVVGIEIVCDCLFGIRPYFSSTQII